MKNKRTNEVAAAVVFLSPNILGFLVFTLVPVLFSFYLSFTKWNLLSPPEWAGLESFSNLLKDPSFSQTMWNTLIFSVGLVPTSIVLSLFFAVMLNARIRGILVFRTIFFIPVVMTTVGAALAWRWLLTDDIGYLHYLLSSLNILSPSFLGDSDWAMASLVVVSIWKGLGFSIVLLLAGLQGISPSYYEAAAIDGATRSQEFFRITLPLLTPALFFTIFTLVVSSFQTFDQTFVLTKGGPAFATTTVVYYIYQKGFEGMNMGVACAAASVLFVITLVISVVQWWAQKRWVNYG